MVLLFLLAFIPAAYAAALCSYNDGDVSARWAVKGYYITIEIANKNLTNNQWTGIAFGPDMFHLEIVIVSILDENPSFATGYTDYYAPPIIDARPNVALKLLSYDNNELVFRFSRPLGPTGDRRHSLEDCQMWSFVDKGDILEDEMLPHSDVPKQVKVCPLECKGDLPSKK
ncbi:unnamed protein product [Heligmosomoides polygyrus]|uniref:DOMON domain-containing protein n=1 Tax=Heligmosomoides polygyrus TaxID=6339 RepID=A0A183GIV5_HELPZ|nr:unnamed protein product [Heligmosomoides polygyrus]